MFWSLGGIVGQYEHFSTFISFSHMLSVSEYPWTGWMRFTAFLYLSSSASSGDNGGSSFSGCIAGELASSS
tara:strand:- start:3551 stop:3763 length:213 start_codon:yes stop_codon:yes gene_type:complete